MNRRRTDGATLRKTAPAQICAAMAVSQEQPLFYGNDPSRSACSLSCRAHTWRPVPGGAASGPAFGPGSGSAYQPRRLYYPSALSPADADESLASNDLYVWILYCISIIGLPTGTNRMAPVPNRKRTYCIDDQLIIHICLTRQCQRDASRTPTNRSIASRLPNQVD